MAGRLVLALSLGATSDSSRLDGPASAAAAGAMGQGLAALDKRGGVSYNSGGGAACCPSDAPGFAGRIRPAAV